MQFKPSNLLCIFFYNVKDPNYYFQFYSVSCHAHFSLAWVGYCWGFPGGPMVKNPPTMQEKRFDPWVRNIPWSRKLQTSPVFVPGKSHGQRSLAGYSPWDCKRLGHDLVAKEQQRTAIPGTNPTSLLLIFVHLCELFSVNCLQGLSHCRHGQLCPPWLVCQLPLVV